MNEGGEAEEEPGRAGRRRVLHLLAPSIVASLV